MKQHLTPEMRERLIKTLVDEGCCCEEQHDEPDDATSLNCLASTALWDLEILEEFTKDLDEKLTRSEVETREFERDLHTSINYGTKRDEELAALRDELVEISNQADCDAYKIRCYENWLESLANIKDTDKMSPGLTHAKWRHVICLSRTLLKDPSLMDPERMATDAKAAKEDLERSDVLTLDELNEQLLDPEQ